MDESEKHHYYYTGGLAELVQNPSDLTFSYLSNWFTGQHSLGLAMKLLHLPYEPLSTSLLVQANNALYINLREEESTLYAKTIFSYAPQSSPEQPPRLTINIRKVCNPLFFFHTLQILFQQSMWIAFPDRSITTAKQFLSSLPSIQENSSIEEINKILQEHVWPTVLAISMLHEFYSQLLEREAKNDLIHIQQDISQQISEKDWFFRSLSDQLLVKTGSLSFEEYIKTYGVRGDQDYELTCPRWWEIPEEIKKRIEDTPTRTDNRVSNQLINPKIKKLVDSVIEFQLIRVEAKRKALVWINSLRQLLLSQGKISEKEHPVSPKLSDKQSSGTSNGKGLPVSQGEISGIARHITTSIHIPENTIGIFTQAGTDLSHLYSKCVGLIFLSGGQMSHGSIVAREYHIPALIDSHAQDIPEERSLSLNGTTGTWEIIST